MIGILFANSKNDPDVRDSRVVSQVVDEVSGYPRTQGAVENSKIRLEIIH